MASMLETEIRSSEGGVIQWLHDGVKLFVEYAKLILGEVVKIGQKLKDGAVEYAQYLVHQSFVVTSRLPVGEIRVVPVKNGRDTTLIDFFVMENNVIKVLRKIVEPIVEPAAEHLSSAFQAFGFNQSDSSNKED